MTGHTEDAYRQAAETSGDAFLLKRTLGTVLVPTLQLLRALSHRRRTPRSCTRSLRVIPPSLQTR